MSSVRYVAVGRVGRPHGVRGEVRLDPMGGLPEGLRGYTRFYIARRGGAIRPIELESHRAHSRLLIAKFAGYDTPETARGLTGSLLYVDRSEMPALGEGEYYHADLLDCRLKDEQGRDLGRVVDVFRAGVHDVLVIESGGGRDWMLPVVAEWVLSMDLEEGEIVARVPEDLSD